MAEEARSRATTGAVESPGTVGAGVGESGVTEALRRLRVIPVVVIRDPLKATPLAHALVDGGLPCAEITLRTPGAIEAIRRIAGEAPDLLLGAGTVLTPEQASEAFEAGARFIVSPGFDPRVVDCCRSRGIPVYPGVCTPTEVTQAMDRGVDTLKFFPAEPMGGAPFLEAIAAPFPALRWIPTGGIGLAQLPEYLKLEAVVACGGSWIAPAARIETGAFDQIRGEAERAMAAARAAGSGGTEEAGSAPRSGGSGEAERAMAVPRSGGSGEAVDHSPVQPQGEA